MARIITKSEISPTRTMSVLMALPSVLAIISVVIVGVLMLQRPGSPPDWYRSTGDDAFDAHDFRTASVCYQRLLQAKPDSPDIAMNLAQCLAHIGQADSAASLLYRLAPADRPGYFPAQIALASAILQGTRPTATSLAAAEKHLTQAAIGRPNDSQVNGWMAVVLAWRGDWDSVHSRMDTFNQFPPSLCHRLSDIAQTLGNKAEAQRWNNATRADAVRPN